MSRLPFGQGLRSPVLPLPLICTVCPQDEVAHTVTESRVLQNTRHPFLTVSSLPANPWKELKPCYYKHSLGVGPVGQAKRPWAPRLLEHQDTGWWLHDSHVWE